MSKGIDFEILVARIEKAFHNLPGAEVIHNIKLKTDKGVTRQIDILITIDTGRFIFKTIIECKNKKAKIEVSYIDAFKELVRSVGAHQGIIVSASGFQKGALNSSKDTNIHLYQLSQVAELEKYLLEYRLNFLSLKHQSKDIVVRFKEIKDINNNLTSRTLLTSPILNEKVSIADIATDFLSRNKDDIINALLCSPSNLAGVLPIIGTTEINIEPSLPLLFQTDTAFTEVTGFRALIETTLSVKPLEIINISEYRDLLEAKTHALIIDFKIDDQIQQWIADQNSS